MQLELVKDQSKKDEVQKGDFSEKGGDNKAVIKPLVRSFFFLRRVLVFDFELAFQEHLGGPQVPRVIRTDCGESGLMGPERLEPQLGIAATS